MARLIVNPTRMELLGLRRRLKTAEQGYKLLKDKRDGLMKEFMEIIREVRNFRKKVEFELQGAFKNFLYATANILPEELEEILSVPTRKIRLEAKIKNVMGVNISEFTYEETGDFLCYSLGQTPSDLDESIRIFSETTKDLVKLAQIEYSAKLLAVEIEKTRRRVNALEYVFIPDIKETIKYIEAKLIEQERSVLITLMKVKEKIG